MPVTFLKRRVKWCGNSKPSMWAVSLTLWPFIRRFLPCSITKEWIEKLTFFIQIVPLLSTKNIVYGHSIIKPVFWYTYYGTMLIKIAL